LRQQAVQDVVNGGIPGVVALLRYSVLYVVCMALAGLAWLQYGYIDWVALQAVPWTATDEYLAAWGALKNVFLKQASCSTGSASFTATSTAQIPVGTAVQISGSVGGVTTGTGSYANGLLTVPVVATTAGSVGNVAAGSAVNLTSSVAGVQMSGTAATAFTGGANVETQSAFRTRVLDAFQAGGANGKSADYVDWALDVDGVTRAWVNPNGFGAGTVVVYVMLDDAESAYGGFPQGTNGTAAAETRGTAATGDQLAVANAIFVDQTVTAEVWVCAPIAQPIDFAIADLGTDNTAANQAAITSALQDMFLRLSKPGGTIYPSQWNEAVGALGLSQFYISSPTAPIVAPGVGNLPTLGTVSFAS